MKKKDYSRFELFIIASGNIFGSLFNDFFNTIAKSRKEYHVLIGGFVYLILSSIFPLYYVFVGDIDGLYNDGSFNSESGDFVTYLSIFKFSVYIFIICIIYFFFKQYLNIRGDIKKYLIRETRKKQFNNLLETHTIPEDEDGSNK